MSDTTPDGTRTLHAAPAPAPEPLTGLTGAPATIYTHLMGLTEPATAAELALAAGLGRSTTGKALAILEEHSLAVREPGGHDGARRTPDRWHPAPTSQTTGDDSGQEPANAQPEPSADASESVSGGAGREEAPIGEIAPADGLASLTAAPVTGVSQDTEHGGNDEGGEDHSHGGCGNDDPGDGDTPAPQASAERQTALAEAVIVPGEKRRLAPGALRQMVIAHLDAHPGQAFTATKISRVIEKSSGAVANALVTLARQGIAEQVDDRPRTYRLVTPEDNG
ncbi:hypothetical protein ACIQWL_42665 [Streptomyces mirabilis]|uniref:hypothetical protein n=1 Tax=Streptomyces mirabilis TaxID=68239 RepID=UPI0033D6EDF2